ncbi:peroxidase P7-like [Lolium rigidum]|uniref:peroxidase P7-like n=1 Tax=Lolium rigidum TaxID=89674 RepID=UPI001F5D4ED0|nr:peroxidase P7-like [Lolium rigidum]
MASSRSSSWVTVLALLLFVALAHTANGADPLSAGYYAMTCPNAERIVSSVMANRVGGGRMASAVLRLFFHDCFVNGCDASVLLDGPESEKDAEPNLSLTGFTVIDEIKAALERDCPATVSCADVLALASRDAVTQLGGPTWNVPLGRKDSRFAPNKGFTTQHLPKANDNLGSLIQMFGDLGLDARDLTALSGAHTVGMSNCENYRERIYGTSDTKYNIDPSFAETRRQMCPLQGPSGDAGKAPFDKETPRTFDNAYYRDLIAHQGLLNSDQALYSGSGLDSLVVMYGSDNDAFGRDFAKAMVKMGNIAPPMGMPTEVRLHCSKAN